MISPIIRKKNRLTKGFATLFRTNNHFQPDWGRSWNKREELLHNKLYRLLRSQILEICWYVCSGWDQLWKHPLESKFARRLIDIGHIFISGRQDYLWLFIILWLFIYTNVVRGTTGPGVEYFLSNYLPEHNDTEACLTDHVSPFFEGSLPRINVGHTRFQFWTNFRERIMVWISNKCHLFNDIIYRAIFVKYRRVIKHTGSEHYLLSWI